MIVRFVCDALRSASHHHRILSYVLMLCDVVWCTDIHFQYNGILLGVFIVSIALIRRGEDLWSGFVFAVLLNMKHIFLYVAPVYFIYLLAHYCYPPVTAPFWNWEQFHRGVSGRRFSILNLLKMGAVVIGVFACSLGPFIRVGRLSAIVSRLFPVTQRGLCHAYWAPNVWAIYNTVDRMAIVVWRALTGVNLAAAASSTGIGSMTGGLVHAHSTHVVLPGIDMKATLLVTVAFMLV